MGVHLPQRAWRTGVLLWRARVASMMWRNLPSGWTVRPTDASAPRNSSRRSDRVTGVGERMVTFLPAVATLLDSSSGVQVRVAYQVIRSATSVSGFRLTLIFVLAG